MPQVVLLDQLRRNEGIFARLDESIAELPQPSVGVGYDLEESRAFERRRERGRLLLMLSVVPMLLAVLPVVRAALMLSALLLTMLRMPVLLMITTLLAVMTLAMLMLRMTAVLVLALLRLRLAPGAAFCRVAITVEAFLAFLAVPFEPIIEIAGVFGIRCAIRCAAGITRLAVTGTAERPAVRIVGIKLPAAPPAPASTTPAPTAAPAIARFAFLLRVDLARCAARVGISAIHGVTAPGRERLRRGCIGRTVVDAELRTLAAARWHRSGRR
ncbi:MAG: hypothetical protein ACKO3W_05480 [bacterium]